MSELKKEVLTVRRFKGGFKVEEVIVTRKETTIYWKGVEVPDDFDELLDDLKRSDGWAARTVIYNTKIAKVLETTGCAHRNARGSYGGNEKAIDEVYKLWTKARTWIWNRAEKNKK